MSSLRDSYDRITFNNNTKSIQEKAVKYGALRRMLNTWTIPANSSVYLSAVTPDISLGRGALLGRAIETVESVGIKYKVWLGSVSVVYDASPEPTFVSSESLTIWKKVTSVDLTSAVLVDEFWLPSGSQAAGGSGSFEQVEEIRIQPNNTEIIIEITNLDSNQAHDVLLQLTYLEDIKGLILYPGGQ
jgi:hypothetical protein